MTAAVIALSAALALLAATPAKKKSASKTAAKAPAAKTAKTSKSKTTKKAATKQTAATRYRRSTQREPAPERYKEIQQSLADKGYFKGVVDGTWGPNSVDALKRFQRDQNIGDDGKLGSLSLIALGLGPKRSEIPAANAPPP